MPLTVNYANIPSRLPADWDKNPHRRLSKQEKIERNHRRREERAKQRAAKTKGTLAQQRDRSYQQPSPVVILFKATSEPSPLSAKRQRPSKKASQGLSSG